MKTLAGLVFWYLVGAPAQGLAEPGARDGSEETITVQPAEGSEVEELTALSLDQLLNMVVSPTLISQRLLDAPSSVVVVSAKTIAERGYRFIKDVAMDVPGFEDVGDANEEIIAMRGTYSSTTNKILILLNGHRMNDYLLGRYNMDQFIGLDAVARIEFVRGPSSTTFGTGALTGVINIITKKGAQVNGVRVRARGGPYAHEAGLSWGGVFGGLDIMFNFTYLDAPGQKYNGPAAQDGAVLSANPPDPALARAGDLYVRRYPNNWSSIVTAENERVQVTLRGSRFARQQPRTASLAAYYTASAEPFPPIYNEDDFLVDFVYKLPLNNKARVLKINPSYHYFTYHELSFQGGLGADRLPPIGTRGGQISETSNAQLKVVYEDQPFDSLLVLAQVDGTFTRFPRTDGVGFADGVATLTPSGAYVKGKTGIIGGLAQALWTPFLASSSPLLNRLTLSAGARLDAFDVGGKFARLNIVPRVGIVEPIGDNLSLKALYGRSVLAPLWGQLNSAQANFLGNTDLTPELYDSVNLVLMYDNQSNLSVDVDLFYNYSSALITAQGNTYVNTGKTAYYGTDISANYKVISQLSLQAAYSLVLPNESVMKSEVSRSNLLNDSIYNIPTSIFRYGLRLEPVANLSLLLWGRAYSPVNTVNPITQVTNPEQDGPEVTLPAVFLLEAAINYAWNGLEMQLSATNLTNTRYSVGTTPSGVGRSPMPRGGIAVEGMLAYKF